MAAQIRIALHTLETVLRKAGYEFSDVVRLNIYTTDVDEFFAHYGEFARRVAGVGADQHAGSHGPSRTPRTAR